MPSLIALGDFLAWYAMLARQAWQYLRRECTGKLLGQFMVGHFKSFAPGLQSFILCEHHSDLLTGM